MTLNRSISIQEYFYILLQSLGRSVWLTALMRFNRYHIAARLMLYQCKQGIQGSSELETFAINASYIAESLVNSIRNRIIWLYQILEGVSTSAVGSTDKSQDTHSPL